MDTVIEFKDVGKTYTGERMPAIRDVSFSVGEGEFVCIVGPSGSGKSTILKLIAGLEDPTTGAIKKPASVGMSFQLGALLPWRSVFDNVALGLEERGSSREKLRIDVETELARVGMLEFRDKYPADLSGGERQRVGIARALAIAPQVLLLDEPFSALDPKTTAELHDDLIEIWRQTKKTVLMVSHLIEEAVSLAERVILMKNATIASIYPITLPYPRRENEGFHREVMHIRHEFFK